jgi:hypothetical protein
MSIWIRAVCRSAVAFAADELKTGIGERLTLLTALYCPDEEEPASEVLKRLQVETVGPNIWALRYRNDHRFIRVERWRNGVAQKEGDELRERLNDSQSPAAAAVHALLDDVAEISGFELKASDANGMGWPIAISAAAWVTARGDGLVQAEGEGWMAPTAKEIRPVLNENMRRR